MMRLLALTHFLLFIRLILGKAASNWVLVPDELLFLGMFFAALALFVRKISSVFLLGTVLIWLFISKLGLRNVAHEFLLWITIASLIKEHLAKFNIQQDFFDNGLWLFFGVNYFYSGIEKLKNNYWLNGDALDLILQSHAANLSIFSDILRALPLFSLTYFVLALELLVLPLGLVSSVRKWLWLCLMLLHIGIALTLRMEEISLIMLITQLILFKKEWFHAFLKFKKMKD